MNWGENLGVMGVDRQREVAITLTGWLRLIRRKAERGGCVQRRRNGGVADGI